MNSYPDIVAALDKFLREGAPTEESRQVAALAVALAHRVEKDFELVKKEIARINRSAATNPRAPKRRPNLPADHRDGARPAEAPNTHEPKIFSGN